MTDHTPDSDALPGSSLHALDKIGLTRAILDSSLDGIVTIDHEARILEFSAAAERIFGWTREEVMGKSISDFIIPERMRDAHAAGMARFMRTRESKVLEQRLELPAVRKSGEEFPAELTIVRIPDAEPPMFTAFLRDITRAQQQKRALEEAMAALTKASQAKSEFMAVMSHEIRTPMNAILGMTDLALATSLTREQQGLLQSVQANAESLLSIITDILDFSKIEAAHMVLRSEHLSIADIVEGVAEALGARSFEKDVELISSVDPAIPPVVMGDTGRVRQILVNLAGNAVRFTDAGTVFVRAELLSMKKSHAVVRFAVEDTGAGIASEDLERIFLPFVQADSSLSRQHGGTGLGLGITKSLAEAMGGSIGARSELKVGSTFTVEIPFELTDFRYEARRASDLDFGEFLGSVTTDSPLVRRAAETVMSSLGTALEEPSSTGQGLRRLRLLDLPCAPEGDGEALARLAAEEHDEGDVRIVLLAPGSRPPELPSGVRGVSKPLTRRKLARVLLDAREERGETGLPPAPVKAGTRRWAKSPHVLVVEDNPGNQRYVLRVLEDASYTASLAIDGNEGVRMAREQHFDLIITDVQMPSMDGLTMTEQIRKEEAEDGRTPVPILALTAHAGAESRQRCLEAGMDGFLEKPFRGPELLAMLFELLKRTPTILIVDDDRDSRNLIARYLEGSGVHLAQAGSLAEARERISEMAPDVLLTDFILPDGDGLSLIEDALGRPTPPREVILVTGVMSDELFDRMEQVGCTAHLLKPVRQQAFQQAMAPVLERLRGGIGEPLTRAVVPEGEEMEATAGDGETVLVDDDIADLVAGFLESCVERSHALRAAVQISDMETASHIGHGLAGSGLGYGFIRITEFGRAVEAAVESGETGSLLELAHEFQAYLDGVKWRARGA